MDGKIGKAGLSFRSVHTRGGGGGGGIPIYDMVRMCGPNSPLFQHCQVHDKPPFSKKTVYDRLIFLDWYMNGPILNVHIFAQIFNSETQTETKLYYLCVTFEYN